MALASLARSGTGGGEASNSPPAVARVLRLGIILLIWQAFTGRADYHAPLWSGVTADKARDLEPASHALVDLSPASKRPCR